MKNILYLSLTVVLLLSIAGCGQPSVDQAKANFCQDLGEFATAVVNLRQIDSSSTKQELQDAFSAAQRAWDDLKNSAGSLQNAQVDGVEAAVNDLQRSIDDIPDDATLEQGLVAVRGASLATLAEIVKITNTTCSYPQEQ
jgi:tetrahydromethanopterin S-methyltransferase subunit F